MPPPPPPPPATGDLLLKLSQNPALRPWIAKLGLPTPLLLDRGAEGRFSMPPLANRPVTLLAPPYKAHPALASMLVQRLGAHLAENGASNVVVDATAVRTPADVSALAMEVLQPLALQKMKHGRVVFLTQTTPDHVMSTALSSGVAALVRSLAKEMGATGTTVNVVKMLGASCFSNTSNLAPVAWPLAFLLLPDAAFISGQEVTVDLSSSITTTTEAWLASLASFSSNKGLLDGKVCLVTGASRGIGKAISTRLAADGARVLGVDMPNTAPQLEALMEELGGVPFLQDVTQEAAPLQLRDFVVDKGGGKLDCLVHNAGLTRDKTLRRMSTEQFQQVVRVNVEAVLRINRAFGLGYGSDGSEENQPVALLNPNGRILLLASINGIAGAFGQTNYSFTKAALMGYAQSFAPLLAAQGPPGATINAIAPGFIETDMTKAIPAMGKFMGRRANAFSQGGLPEDIAAAAAFLCCDGAAGVTGQTLRVCGLNAVGK